MTITEITILQFVPPYTKSSPEWVSWFETCAERQKAWSGHPLLFFENPQVEGSLYLVSGWTSLQAHTVEWLQSAENQPLFQLSQRMTEFKGFLHLDIDFSEMPEDVAYLEYEEERESEGVSSGQERGESEWEGRGKALDEGNNSKMILWAYTDLKNKEVPGTLLRRVVPSATTQ